MGKLADHQRENTFGGNDISIVKHRPIPDMAES